MYVRRLADGGGVKFTNGTSFSAPQIAGAAAILKARDSTLTAASLKELLCKYAIPLQSDPGHLLGCGRVAIPSVFINERADTLGVDSTATLTAERGGVREGTSTVWRSLKGLTEVTGSDLHASVLGLAPGVDSIEVKAGFAADTVEVIVNDPRPHVASVSVVPSAPSIERGQSVQLIATARDSTGAAIPNVSFDWLSSDAQVASVSGSGLVAGLGAGSATITASAGGKSGSATVTVTCAPSDATCPGAGPPALFEVRATYESFGQFGNGGFGLEYCGGGFYGRFGDLPCVNASEQGAPAYFLTTDHRDDVGMPIRPGMSISGTISDRSATLDMSMFFSYSDVKFKSPYGDAFGRDAGGSIQVFVLGAPGTAYELQHSYSYSVSAAKSSGNGCEISGQGLLRASIGGLSASAVVTGPISANAVAANSPPIRGTTRFPTRTFRNQVYSFAGEFTESGSVTHTAATCEEHLTGEARATGRVTVIVRDVTSP